MSINKWCIILIFLLTAVTTLAQSLTGRVVDIQHTRLEGVSIVLCEKATHKPLAFTRTDANGQFSLLYPTKRDSTLIFTLFGYAKDSIEVQHFRSGQTVVLKEESYQIKKVLIKSPRIAQRGDTLTYLLNVFKQQQDRTIADVIAKMPGLQVNDDGSIEY